MKTPLKTLLVSAVALSGFAAIDTAQAGGKRHHGGHHKSYYGGHYGYKHYGYRRHHGYRGGYHYRHHGHHGHHKAGKILGYSLLGAIVGYGIYKAGQRSRDRYYDDRYYRRNDNYYRGAPQGNYYQGQPQGGYNQQAPQNYSAPQGGTRPQSNFDFSQCEDTRQYETTIVVDGQEQPAYGTACLMPSGQWVAGPMKF